MDLPYLHTFSQFYIGYYSQRKTSCYFSNMLLVEKQFIEQLLEIVLSNILSLYQKKYII